VPALGKLDAGGTIEAIGRGAMRIKTVAGQAYLLQLAEKTEVHVVGTAKADVLSRGSFISFFAEVNKHESEVQEKIGELTLFTPSPQRPLGAFPGGRPAAGDQPFGENPLAPGGGLQAPGAEQPPPARKARTRRRRAAAQDEDAGPPVETFEIVGRINAIDRSGEITVYAPNPYFKPAVEIELTEDPLIHLDLAGARALFMARPGDRVQVRGQQIAPNVVRLSELTVDLAQPFTTVPANDAEKKPPKRTRTSRRSRDRTEEEADEEKADEDVEKEAETPKPKED
jgi:hypothetical protein